jgi:hypothetical protein
MRRKRSAGKRSYSLAYLLEKQPAGIQKHKRYQEILLYYRSSERLKKLRFNRRCYSLLLHAKIAPRNLDNFYRTYRLPRDPFFPLYFAVKREYLAALEEKRAEKRKIIVSGLKTLPRREFDFLLYLASLEQRLNSTGACPLWAEELFPSSRKKLSMMLKYTREDWIERYRIHLSSLAGRYRSFEEAESDRILAGFILEIIPGRSCTGKDMQTAVQDVKNAYRRLCKEYHPDAGGDPVMFVHLKWAEQTLLAGSKKN